jgi:mannosyltransferase
MPVKPLVWFKVKLRAYWPVAVLMLVALWLRRYQIGYQSLWFDEADAVMRSHAPLFDLVKMLVRPGENGPLYLILLHLWVSLFGDAESRVRTLSAVFGVLTVPVAFLLGGRFQDRGAALLSALLVTISPFHIWQSQEAKMYAMATFFAGVSTFIVLHWKDLGRLAWTYPFVSLCSVFSHLFGLMLVPYHLVVLWVTRPVRSHLWPALIAIMLLLPLTLALGAAALMGTNPVRLYRPMGVPEMIAVMLRTFSVNRADAFTEGAGALVAGTLATLGVATLLATRRLDGLLLAGLLLMPLVPFVAVNRLLGLFEERYLFVSYLGYVVATSIGIRWIWSRRWPLGLVALACVAILNASALIQVNYSQGPNRENWREAVRYLSMHFRDVDAVAVQPGYLVSAVEYYARQYPNLRGVPLVTAPSMDRPDVSERDMEAALTKGTFGKERVWLFYDENRSSLEDTKARVWEWFHYNWYLTDTQAFIGFRLYNYSFNGPYKVSESWPQVRVRVTYDSSFALVGIDYGTGDRRPEVARGQIFPLTLRWLLTRVPPASPIIRLDLARSDGTPAVRQESPFLNGFLEMRRLRPSQVLWDYRDMEIPQALEPGRYDLYLTVFEQDGTVKTGHLSGGFTSDRVHLGSVWVR